MGRKKIPDYVQFMTCMKTGERCIAVPHRATEIATGVMRGEKYILVKPGRSKKIVAAYFLALCNEDEFDDIAEAAREIQDEVAEDERCGAGSSEVANSAR